MNIEIGSKWVKDDEVVEVLDFFVSGYTIKNNFKECLVILFLDEKEFSHTLTERDFLEQYKPYEEVYEYRFMYQLNDINFGEWHLHPAFYKTVEDCINYTTRSAYNFQRLDFTKRERKQ